MTPEFKEGDHLRVIDTKVSGGHFKDGQIVVVEQGDLFAHTGGDKPLPVVKLYGQDSVWTLEQFEKIESPPTLARSRSRSTTSRSERLNFGGEVAEIHRARVEAQADKIAKHITTDPRVRAFSSGATRDLDTNKFDYEGFLSPLVLKRYAEHMHKARKMPNGDMRASDNWQLGIPLDVYMKSLFRHFFDVWSTHRGYSKGDIESELCALLFNANGYLHEYLKAKSALPSE